MIDFNVEYISHDVFGQIVASSLQLEAPLVPVRLSSKDLYRQSVEINGVVVEGATCNFDILATPIPQELMFIPLFKWGWPVRSMTDLCLLIQHADQSEGSLRRVGILELVHSSLPEDLKTIIDRIEIYRSEMVLV